MHARTAIRQYLATQLGGLATTGTRVHVGDPYVIESLPALVIDTVSEERGEEGGGVGQHTRVLTISLIALASANNVDPSVTLDQIELEIAAVIGADAKLGGLVDNISWSSSTYELLLDEETTERQGTLEITYQAIYCKPDADLSGA